MLKKIANVVITAGLLFVSLGASAMVNESPFPVCYDKECATLSPMPQENYILASTGDTTALIGRRQQTEEQVITEDSAFPVDYGSSRD